MYRMRAQLHVGSNADTTVFFKMREGEDGAHDAVATFSSNSISFHTHTGRQKVKRSQDSHKRIYLDKG